jgi:hypothetical protein
MVAISAMLITTTKDTMNAKNNTSKTLGPVIEAAKGTKIIVPKPIVSPVLIRTNSIKPIFLTAWVSSAGLEISTIFPLFLRAFEVPYIHFLTYCPNFFDSLAFLSMRTICLPLYQKTMLYDNTLIKNRV